MIYYEVIYQWYNYITEIYTYTYQINNFSNVIAFSNNMNNEDNKEVMDFFDKHGKKTLTPNSLSGNKWISSVEINNSFNNRIPAFIRNKMFNMFNDSISNGILNQHYFARIRCKKCDKIYIEE